MSERMGGNPSPHLDKKTKTAEAEKPKKVTKPKADETISEDSE